MTKRQDKRLLAKRQQHNAEQKAKRARGEKSAPRVSRKQPRKPNGPT